MMNNINFEKRIFVTACHDHLGGIFGEALLRFFLKENLIKMEENDYVITDKGWDELEIIGIDVEKLRSKNTKNLSICFESNHGILYEHLGSYLGNLLMLRMIDLDWIKKNPVNFNLSWKSPLITSFRLICWIFSLKLIKNSVALHKDNFYIIFKSMFQHAFYILTNSLSQ